MSAYEFNAERLEAASVLRRALDAQEARLKEFCRTEIRAEISSFDARMDVKFAELKAYLAETQTSLVKWLFAAFGTQAAFIIAFLKLFP
jgi:hypothetical protein